MLVESLKTRCYKDVFFLYKAAWRAINNIHIYRIQNLKDIFLYKVFRNKRDENKNREIPRTNIKTEFSYKLIATNYNKQSYEVSKVPIYLIDTHARVYIYILLMLTRVSLGTIDNIIKFKAIFRTISTLKP